MHQGTQLKTLRDANDSSFGRNFEANLVLCNFVGCERVCSKVATFHETMLQGSRTIRRTTTTTTMTMARTKTPAHLRAIHVHRSIKTYVPAE